MEEDGTGARAEAMLAVPPQQEVTTAETPAVFLADVSRDLKTSSDQDADLASILSDHLLTVSPHVNAVANAKAAIIDLATKRAAPVEEDTDD